MSLSLLNDPSIAVSINPRFGTLACQTFLISSDDIGQSIGTLQSKTDQITYDQDLEITEMVGILKTTGNIIAYCNEMEPLDLGVEIASLKSTDTALISGVQTLSSDLGLLQTTFSPNGAITDSTLSTGDARYLLSAGNGGNSLLWVKQQKHAWAFNGTTSGVTLSITNSTVPALASGFPSTANITITINIGTVTGNEWMVGCVNCPILTAWYTQMASAGSCLYYLTYEVTGTGASTGNFGSTNNTTNHLALSAAPPLYSYTAANGTVFASALDNTSVITIRLYMKTTSGSTNTITSTSSSSLNGLISAA